MNSVTAQEREDIESLLPWHATGALSRRDARRVDAALASDPDLVRRFEAIREEIAETIHINEMLDVPSSRISERLFAAVDAEAPKTARRSLGLGARLAEFFSGFQVRTLAWAGTAAAVLLVAQSGLLATLFLTEQYGHQPRTTPDKVNYRSIEPAAPQADLLVRFRPAASTTDIIGFLQRNNATLTGGPQDGWFRIRVANVTTRQALIGAMSRIQAEAAVVEQVTAAP